MPPFSDPILQQALLALLPQLSRFCWMLTGVHADADDLLQCTVERLLRKGMPESVDFKPWVFRVCKNLWIDELRARKRQTSVQVDAEIESVPDARWQNKGLEANIGAQQILEQFQRLSDDQCTVLYLVAVEGMSYQEVSDTLSIPLGTVQSRVSRARQQLIKIAQMD